MINKNELRIRNWVYATDILGPSQITELRNDVCGIDGLDLWYKCTYEEITPLPITPFIWVNQVTWDNSDSQLWRIEGNSFRISPSKDQEGRFFANGQSIYQGAVLYVDFVHQLQNLYFALTGKELLINF